MFDACACACAFVFACVCVHVRSHAHHTHVCKHGAHVFAYHMLYKPVVKIRNRAEATANTFILEHMTEHVQSTFRARSEHVAEHVTEHVRFSWDRIDFV